MDRPCLIGHCWSISRCLIGPCGRQQLLHQRALRQTTPLRRIDHSVHTPSPNSHFSLCLSRNSATPVVATSANTSCINHLPCRMSSPARRSARPRRTSVEGGDGERERLCPVCNDTLTCTAEDLQGEEEPACPNAFHQFFFGALPTGPSRCNHRLLFSHFSTAIGLAQFVGRARRQLLAGHGGRW